MTPESDDTSERRVGSSIDGDAGVFPAIAVESDRSTPDPVEEDGERAIAGADR